MLNLIEDDLYNDLIDNNGKGRFWLPYRRMKLSDLEKFGLEIPNDENKEKWQIFLLKLYMHWLKGWKPEFFNNGMKPNLFISFGEGEKRRPEIQRWKGLEFNNISDLVDINLVLTKQGLNETKIIDIVSSTNNIRKEDLKELIECSKNKIMLYDNHNDMYGYIKSIFEERYSEENEKVMKGLSNRVVFQHYMGVKKGLKIFNLLSHPQKDNFICQYLILNLLDTALTKILVIDERVGECFINSKDKIDVEKYKRQTQRLGIYPTSSNVLNTIKNTVNIGKTVKIALDRPSDNTP